MIDLDIVEYSLGAMQRERHARLDRIDRYMLGAHDEPYTPPGASEEYALLVKRCVTNWMPTLVETPASLLCVDGFRRTGVSELDAPELTPAMAHFQRSRMDDRQSALYTGALQYGLAYALTEVSPVDGRTYTYGLSPRTCYAVYDDPATDLDPVAAVLRKREPRMVNGEAEPGLVYAWDSEMIYRIEEAKAGDYQIVSAEPHGATSCPVTRFAPWVDLEGRAFGVVERAIPIQDRINQTMFDLLVAQTYTSFEVRTVTGMAPPVRMRRRDDGSYEPVLDSEGNPVPDRVFLNATRWMYSEDPDVKFGALSGGDVSGFISAAELAVQHLASLTQTPPYYMLGQMANISAEALKASETGLIRKVEGLRRTFGESWERVFRIAAEMEGDFAAAGDDHGEVVWRDMGLSSLAQTADALGKFKDQLDIPARGLWSRVPGVTQQEIQNWERLHAEDVEASNVDSAMLDTVRSFLASSEAGEASEASGGVE